VGPNKVDFVGPEIFKRAVRGMGKAAETVLADAQLELEDISLMIPHQANLRIIDSLRQRFKLTEEQVMVNISQYGNTSAATVPIALCEAVEQGRIKPGDNLISAAFGAGLTYGAGLIVWGDRVERIRETSRSLPACDKTASELLETAIQYCTAAKSTAE
jgi:3-oxoacyl-[acyl-carrier-protein] synthase-3